MINFKSIHVEGFCSIGSLNLSLNEKGTILIKAPNGYGKSSILSAIVWALYGKNLKGVTNVNTWKKYRPKDYRGTLVEIYFESKGHLHKVIRCSNYTEEVEGAKGANRLIYLIDAIPVDDKNKTSIQGLITKNLGMSYQLFMNSIMFGQGLKRLIQESGSDKKQIFEEIFELDYLSKARDIAVSRYKDLDRSVSLLNHTLSTITVNIESARNTLTRISNQEKEYADKVEQDVSNLKAKLNLRKTELKKLSDSYDTKAYKSVKSEIEDISKKIYKHNSKLEAAKRKSRIPLEELLDKIIKLLQNKDYETSLNTLLDVKEAFITIDKSQETINRLQNKKYHLSLQSRELEKVKQQIANLQESINDLSDRITNKKNEAPDFKSLKSESKAKLKEYRFTRRKSKQELSKVTQHRELYKWAYTDPLGNNGIKAFLVESSLGCLNEILDSYSDVLGFNIQFCIDLESSRKDFQTYIYMEGIEVQYEELSGGQKQLCNLAMAFAMNDIMTQAKGINIAFLDEVFENLSQDNIEVVVGLIRKVYKDKTLFLITHHESIPMSNSKTLKVQRINGISHYQY